MGSSTSLFKDSSKKVIKTTNGGLKIGDIPMKLKSPKGITSTIDMKNIKILKPQSAGVIGPKREATTSAKRVG
jgi:hypothetical protein